MKLKSTRRPGNPTEPRVTQLLIVAETETDEIQLGKIALKHNAIFLDGVKKPQPTEGTR